MSAPAPNPPYYVLAAVASPTAPAPSFAHPIIHYQYADDELPPLAGMTAQNTLIMDFDPANPSHTVVHSLNPSLAVTGLRVSDAPGAPPDAKMYVIDVVSTDGRLRRPSNEPPREDQSAALLLARFKQRNALLRSALDYPAEHDPTPLGLQLDHSHSHSPTTSQKPA